MIRISIALLSFITSITALAQIPSVEDLSKVDKSITTLNSQQRNAITPFACIGAESAAAVARATYQCLSARGQFFTLSVSGVEISLLLAANFSVGYAVGPIEKGGHEMRLKISGYKTVGGTILSGGPLRLIGAGLGLGGGISYGVPSDSLFGGQLVIE